MLARRGWWFALAAAASLAGTGIMLGGTLAGVVIGSGAKSWQLRYP